MGKGAKLADIGSRDESIVACPGQDEDANRIVALDVIGDTDDRVVHVKGHRSPGLRPVEGDPGDRAALLEKYVRSSGVHCNHPLFGCRVSGVRCWGPAGAALTLTLSPRERVRVRAVPSFLNTRHQIPIE